MGGKGGKCGCSEPHQAKDFCPQKKMEWMCPGVGPAPHPRRCSSGFPECKQNKPTKIRILGSLELGLTSTEEKEAGKESQDENQHLWNVPRSPTFNPQCKVTLPLRAGNPNFPPRGMGFAVLDTSVASRTCLETHTQN